MADIDRMLDDALAGFDDEEDKGVSGPSTSSPSLPAASSSHSPPPMQQQQGSAPPAAAGAAPSSSLGEKDSRQTCEAAGAATAAPPPKQESLKFDPLKRKKGSSKGNASSTSSSSSANRPALTPQVFQLQEDLAQLLSEWSQAPGADDLGLPGQPLSAAASTQQQQQQQQRPPSVLDALQGLTQRTVEQQAAALPPRPTPAAAAGVGGGVGGVEDQQQMNLIVDTVMQHLLSKDVLYQPMKEIRDKYPPWLERQEAAAASSSSRLQPGDLERYRQQYACIIRLCAAYETEPANTAKIMTLLQEMQACGEPPEDIVADMTNSIAADLGGGGGGGVGGSPLGDINFDDLDLGGLADVPDLKNCPVQ